MKKLLSSVAMVSLLMLAPACAVAQGKQAARSDTYRQLDLFADVFERVRSQYVEEVTDEQLIEAAIAGMLTSLDPHSSFLSKKNFQDLQVQTRGEFGGLGIEVTSEEGVVRVVSPIDDTPAYRAGILPGDYIVALDGESIVGLPLNEAVDKMRGPAGTSLKVTIRRPDVAEPLEFTLTRAVVKVQSVRYRVEAGNVGYIRISSFNEQTQPGLEKAIARLQEELGDNIAGFVLDLRNNPGGLLNAAITVSDSFLERGEIVSTRGRLSRDSDRANAKPGDLTKGKPIVVLINGGSASASEIVAGALQDHRRGIVLGTQSFGKGSVQTIIPLQSQDGIRLTTARYYTPAGRSIQQLGITPDIEVHPAKLEQIAEGQRRREADLRHSLSNPERPGTPPAQAPAAQPGQTPPAQPAPGPTSQRPAPAGGEVEAPATPQPTTAQGRPDEAPFDYQLARAVDLLRGMNLFAQAKPLN